MESGKERIHLLFILLTTSLFSGSGGVFCQSVDNKLVELLSLDSINMLIMHVNDCIQTGRSEEALEYVNILSLHDPLNVDYMFAEGSINEITGDSDRAIIIYQRCIEIDPGYLNAYYNLGVIYYNKALGMYNDAQSIVNESEYDKAISVANNTLAESLPYMEKAYELNSQDIAVIETLSAIYYKLLNVSEVYKQKYLLAEDYLSEPAQSEASQTINTDDESRNTAIAKDNPEENSADSTMTDPGSVDEAAQGVIAGTVSDLEWTFIMSAWGSGFAFYITLEEYPGHLFYFPEETWERYELVEFEGPRELGLMSPAVDENSWEGIIVAMECKKILDYSYFPEDRYAKNSYYILNLEKDLYGPE